MTLVGASTVVAICAGAALWLRYGARCPAMIPALAGFLFLLGSSVPLLGYSAVQFLRYLSNSSQLQKSHLPGCADGGGSGTVNRCSGDKATARDDEAYAELTRFARYIGFREVERYLEILREHPDLETYSTRLKELIATL